MRHHRVDDREIGDHAVAHGVHHAQAAGVAAHHPVHGVAQSAHLPGLRIQGGRGCLLHHDAAPLDVDQDVGCAQVDADLQAGNGSRLLLD